MKLERSKRERRDLLKKKVLEGMQVASNDNRTRNRSPILHRALRPWINVGNFGISGIRSE